MKNKTRKNKNQQEVEIDQNLKGVLVEYQRSELLKQKHFSQLIETYKKHTFMIHNQNTGKKWDKLNQIEISKSTNPMAFDRIKKIFNLVNKRGIKLLDIGFGSGIIESHFYNNNKDVEIHAFDISSSSVNLMEKRYPQWSFYRSSIENFKFKKKYFDFVLALELFEHISPNKIFNLIFNIQRSLKNNGYLVVSVPLNENLESLIRLNSNLNAHTRIYTPELICWELKQTGFKIVSTDFLYAFHNYYRMKSIIVRLFPKLKKPNNMIILAQKS